MKLCRLDRATGALVEKKMHLSPKIPSFYHLKNCLGIWSIFKGIQVKIE